MSLYLSLPSAKQASSFTHQCIVSLLTNTGNSEKWLTSFARRTGELLHIRSRIRTWGSEIMNSWALAALAALMMSSLDTRSLGRPYAIFSATEREKRTGSWGHTGKIIIRPSLTQYTLRVHTWFTIEITLAHSLLSNILTSSPATVIRPCVGWRKSETQTHQHDVKAASELVFTDFKWEEGESINLIEACQ